MNIDPAPSARATSNDGWPVVPGVASDNSVPLVDDDRLPPGLESLHVAPGTSVSVVRVRADRWTLTEAGGFVHRLERIETSRITRNSAFRNNGTRWLRAVWAVTVGVPALLIAAFIGWSMRDVGTQNARTASMMVAVPLFDDAVQPRGSRGQDPAPLAAVTPLAPSLKDAKAGPEIARAPALLSQDAALALAFASDDAQQWTDGDASGWVVVGPAEAQGDKSCRNVAVLTQIPGEPDQTRNERKCRSADGTLNPP